jgi:HEAT repeat protein
VVDLNKAISKSKPRFSEKMIQDCLLLMQSGDIEELFEIIPRIGVLRDPRFHEPLLELLLQQDIKRREFAAYAMGAMGNREFLEPLKKAFIESTSMKGSRAEELQIAVIEAIGAIGDDAAVDFFLPVLRSSRSDKSARKLPGWIVESLGAIAQQGGIRSMEALIELVRHGDPEIQSRAISELSVAYWHRPNEISRSTLELIYELTRDSSPIVAESALAALQSLADVGCHCAEDLFSSQEDGK